LLIPGCKRYLLKHRFVIEYPRDRGNDRVGEKQLKAPSMMIKQKRSNNKADK